MIGYRNYKIYIISVSFLILFMLFGCSPVIKDVHITDLKMATALDERLMPVKATSVFPQGTTKVFCWLQWKDTKVNTEITAKWHYVTDDIHIFDSTFTIPRRKGSGGVSLSMPAGKEFPSGIYRVDLVKEKHILKSLTFEVE